MLWKVKAQTFIFNCSFFLVIAVYRESHDTKDAKVHELLHLEI